MVRYTHGELAGSGSTGDFFFDAAKQARDTLCDIHSKYSGAVTGINGEISPGVAVIRDALLNNICKDSPTPPPADLSLQFSGGQCPTKYRMVFEVQSGVPPQIPVTFPYGVNVWGNISGISIKKTSTGTQETLCVRCHGLASGAYNPELVTLELISSFYETFTSVELQQVYTVDGDPDVCGNPNPQYPPTSSRPLPVPFPVPPFIPPTAPSFPIPIVVPVGVFIKPDFNITIDVGGIEFNFDAGGVTFELGNFEGCTGEPGTCSAPPGGDFPDDYANKDDVAEIIEKAQEGVTAAQAAQKAADDAANNDGDHPQNDPNKQNKEQKEEDDPKEEDAIERLLAVEVEILERPSNARVQNGDQAPDIIYAGWFEFKTKGTPHPRVPIHFDRNYFIAPVGADGFAYTVYNGFRARHKIITAKALP